MVICCYLIYSLGKSGDEAIAHFKSHRNGPTLGSKSQRNTIKAFERCTCVAYSGLKEKRRLFFDQPKYCLAEYVTVQMLINLVDENEARRRTPHLVERILKHFEMLVESRTLHKKKIFAAFFDPCHAEQFAEPWSAAQEEELREMKRQVNEHKFQVGKQADVRVLAQAVLDFFENTTEPCISFTTVAHLSEQLQHGRQSLKVVQQQAEAKSSTSQKMHRVELVLLMRIKQFLVTMTPLKLGEEEFCDKFVARLLLALLQAKDAAQGLFEGRSLKRFEFSQMLTLKKLNGALAQWVNEEVQVDKHVKVLGSQQSKLAQSVLNKLDSFSVDVDTSPHALKAPLSPARERHASRNFTYRKTRFSQMVPVEGARKVLRTFHLDQRVAPGTGSEKLSDPTPLKHPSPGSLQQFSPSDVQHQPANISRFEDSSSNLQDNPRATPIFHLPDIRGSPPRSPQPQLVKSMLHADSPHVYEAHVEDEELQVFLTDEEKRCRLQAFLASFGTLAAAQQARLLKHLLHLSHHHTF